MKSAALALEQANTETREQVLQFVLAAPEKHSAAAIARLKLAELDSRYHSQLIAVVHHAPLDLARKALIQAMEDGVVQLDAVVKQAFQRPEIGGLAVAAYEAAGLKQAEMLWDALAQMHLGADAARVLAKTASDLEKRVASSIDTANPIARSRMLLALKLRNTEASHALLARILQSAEWLTAQQRVEVASWL